MKTKEKLAQIKSKNCTKRKASPKEKECFRKWVKRCNTFFVILFWVFIDDWFFLFSNNIVCLTTLLLLVLSLKSWWWWCWDENYSLYINHNIYLKSRSWYCYRSLTLPLVFHYYSWKLFSGTTNRLTLFVDVLVSFLHLILFHVLFSFFLQCSNCIRSRHLLIAFAMNYSARSNSPGQKHLTETTQSLLLKCLTFAIRVQI